jgi:molybdopterin synthase catalytic subunit
MAITIHLFARFRELLRQPTVEVSLVFPATVADLRRELARQYPLLAGLLEHSTVAINQEYALPAMPVCPEDEVALIPPVSGGSGSHP